MMKVMRFDQAAEQFDLFLFNLANNGYCLEIADLFSKDLAKSILKIMNSKLLHCQRVQLVCEPNDKWTVVYVCVPYLSSTIFSNSVYIFTIVGEILWKSVFTQEQKMLRTLQRYDGPTYLARNTSM